MNGLLADGPTASKAFVVPFGECAEDMFYEMKRRWWRSAFAKKGRPEESIYGRIVENALKIALVIAIGVDADKPVITTDRLEHGLAVAEYCAETTLHEIKHRLADNDRQREHVEVKRIIFEAGWVGIRRQQLLERLNGRFNERRLDEILQSLESGSKEVVAILRSTGGRKAYRYVAAENLSANEREAQQTT